MPAHPLKPPPRAPKWQHATRPREKMRALGVQGLTDAELLSLLLRTGTPQSQVIDFASEILDRVGGLRGLLKASPSELLAISGIGPAKQAELSAVGELVTRALSEALQRQPVFNHPDALRSALKIHLSHRQHEVFSVLFLDTQHQLIAFEDLFQGTLSQTTVYPREIAVRALHHHAASVILAHNHPSGLPTPSEADKRVTEAIQAALRPLDIAVLDHCIVAGPAVYSMAENGLMPMA
jgi:DNA repair protein RadC